MGYLLERRAKAIKLFAYSLFLEVALNISFRRDLINEKNGYFVSIQEHLGKYSSSDSPRFSLSATSPLVSSSMGS